MILPSYNAWLWAEEEEHGQLLRRSVSGAGRGSYLAKTWSGDPKLIAHSKSVSSRGNRTGEHEPASAPLESFGRRYRKISCTVLKCFSTSVGGTVVCSHTRVLYPLRGGWAETTVAGGTPRAATAGHKQPVQYHFVVCKTKATTMRSYLVIN